MKKTLAQLNQETCDRFAEFKLSPAAQEIVDTTDFNSMYELFGDVDTAEDFEDFVADNYPEALAQKIRNTSEWNAEDLEKLCEMAGIEDEWDAADGETFERVAYKAAEILGVEI